MQKTPSDAEEGNAARLTSPTSQTPQETNAARFNTINLNPPTLEIQLLTPRFVLFVLSTCLFYGSITIVSYHGVVVEHFYEKVGSSARADQIVERYNTISGYIVAALTVGIGMYMANFLPVLQVFIHNALWKFHKSGLHAFLLFLFPVILMVALGNSLSGLQAAHSTVGFQSIILAEDLVKEMASTSVSSSWSSSSTTSGSSAKATAVTDTILMNAIDEATTPFIFDTDSPCLQGTSGSSENTAHIVPLTVHELALTSVVYGFTPHDWNAEAITHELEPSYSYEISYEEVFDTDDIPTDPTKFDLNVAMSLLLHGKIMVEKAIGDSQYLNHSCSLSDGRTDLDVLPTERERRRRLQTTTGDVSSSSEEADESILNLEPDGSLNQWTYDTDGTRICQGAISSIGEIVEAQALETPTIQDIVNLTIQGLDKSFPHIFDLPATKIYLEKYEITPQISVEAMRVDMMLDASIVYGLTPEVLPCFVDGDCSKAVKFQNASAYMYSVLTKSFCSSDNCAFLDISNTFGLQKEIGLIPFMANCSDVEYSRDFSGFYPTNCTKQTNEAFLYGIGSYITGDEIGSNDTTYGTNAPYLLNPRRHVRLTFAKMAWQIEDVSKSFNATCGDVTNTEHCRGLWYQLKPSGRYLFAGEAALPTTDILEAEFHTPITLVQLNTPNLYVPDWDRTVTLERMVQPDFTRVLWDIDLSGNACSFLMGSYLEQIEANNYYLDRPLQIMYTSAFYYLMANGAVTELNTNTSAAASSADPLGKVKLQGDQQISDIRISIPRNSVIASFLGCAMVLVFAALVLLCPTRQVEYFDEGTTKAQEYIKISNEDAYPSQVLIKTLSIPLIKEGIPLKELEVERLTLIPKADDKDQQFIQL